MSMDFDSSALQKQLSGAGFNNVEKDEAGEMLNIPVASHAERQRVLKMIVSENNEARARVVDAPEPKY